MVLKEEDVGGRAAAAAERRPAQPEQQQQQRAKGEVESGRAPNEGEFPSNKWERKKQAASSPSDLEVGSRSARGTTDTRGTGKDVEVYDSDGITVAKGV